MEERMTVCNMSIEGGARCGYVNPDQTTYDYLRGRDFAPAGAAWDRAVAWWDSHAVRSRRALRRRRAPARRGHRARRHLGHHARAVDAGGRGAARPRATSPRPSARWSARPTSYMQLEPGKPIRGTKIDVAFIGSCTNGRLSDFEEVVRRIRGPRLPRRAAREGAGRARVAARARGDGRVAAGTRCSATPASSSARRAARCASP